MKTIFSIILGTAVMAVGLNVFLIPTGIAAGGVSGVATIVENLFHIQASVTVLVLNLPILILAFFKLPKRVFYFSLLGTSCLSVFLQLFAGVPMVTADKILCAVAGGLLVGIGMGIVFGAGGTTGGTDILAMLLQKKKAHLPIGALVLLSDGLVIILSGVLFKSFEQMIYACLALYISTKTIDWLVVGGDAAKQLIVISRFAPDIANAIMESMERGVTGVRSVGLYSGKESLMLMTVVKKNQIVQAQNMIRNYDKNAFIIVSDVTEVIGKGFK